MTRTKLSDEQLIDLLSEGNKIPDICRMYDIKKFTLERRMEKLKARHGCKTAVQLVVKLKLNGISTSTE